MFDRIAENIGDIISIHPSATIYIWGDYNIHHKEWLKQN